MKNIIIVGGGGFAKEVIWLARDCGFNIICVLDDSPGSIGNIVAGVKVLGPTSDWVKYPNCQLVIAIGDPRTRYKVVKKLKEQASPQFATLVHPDVKLSSSVKIGDGTIICSGCILTVDVNVGVHCILNLNTTVGHDSTINNFVTVAPMVSISGCVLIDDFVEVGTAAAIKQGLTIGKGAMLGMGGVLTKNIPNNLVFAGNPAKKLKELPEI